LTYYQNAVTYGVSHNALAEINIEYAYQTALQCDSQRQAIISSENLSPNEKQTKLTSLGFLYGIPMSLKEPFITANLPATQGCIQYLNHKYTEDGLITRLLKQQGAIPFITSNVPQALLINETMSRCYGRAKNPWDVKRTPGGSSGGEAALIATRSSPLGLGSDNGGSIRIPSAYTGLYGFKPTAERVGSEGHFNGTKNDRRNCENFKVVSGPIGRSVNDLALVVKSLICEELWRNDCEIPPLPWKEEIYLKGGQNKNNNEIQIQKKLKIGFNKTNKIFPTDNANQRAVQEAIEALKTSGYDVEEYEFPFLEEIIMAFFGIATAEGGLKSALEIMKDEPPIDDYKPLVMTSSVPPILLKLVEYLLLIMGEKRSAKLINVLGAKSAWEYFTFSEQHQFLKVKFFGWWRENRLDGFISPGFTLPALKHTTSNELYMAVYYNFIWNFFNCPTGVVPITKVKEEEQIYNDGYQDKLSALAKECCQDAKGLPVGVQVSTLPFNDESCLFLMREIESKINFKELPNLGEK